MKISGYKQDVIIINKSWELGLSKLSIASVEPTGSYCYLLDPSCSVVLGYNWLTH